MSQFLEQLEINNTFLYQFALFGVFFFILSQVYLKPFQRLIEKRNHKLNDDVQSSAELLKNIDSKMVEFEKAISQTRAEAAKSYESALTDVRAREDAVIAQVKDELKKEHMKAVNHLQEEKLKVESELKLQLNQISDSVVQKILAGNN
jgi:F0F1-type ATP synthase membrane subunit b/b'